jgi:hypothetical protein
MKPEDIRLSCSSIDDFFNPPIRQASSGKIRISSLHELSGFQFIAMDKLVHLSKQDFWQLGEDDDGPFITRLVDDSTGPIKE